MTDQVQPPDWMEVAQGGDLTEAGAAFERMEHAQEDLREAFGEVLVELRNELERVKQQRGDDDVSTE